MANEWNLDAIGEALNDKSDLDFNNVLANIDYVVESKFPTTEDPSWYRVYKSGWCEQGGRIDTIGLTTLTFPKSFEDTNYIIQLTLKMSVNAVGDGTCQIFESEMTNSSIMIYSPNATSNYNGCLWEAKGMIETSTNSSDNTTEESGDIEDGPSMNVDDNAEVDFGNEAL